MSHSTTSRRFAVFFSALVLAMLLGAGSALAADPSFSMVATTETTHLAPGGTGKLAFAVVNNGDGETSGDVTVSVDPLPEGITATAIEGEVFFGLGWVCDQSTLSCTKSSLENFRPGEADEVMVKVAVSPSADEGTLSAKASVSGGGSAPASVALPIQIGATPAEFGIESFSAEVRADDQGKPATEAASHPYDAATTIEYNTVDDPGTEYEQVIPAEFAAKDIVVELPAGFVGNPTAVTTCNEEQLSTEDQSGLPLCPTDSQVGLTAISFSRGPGTSFSVPVYNMVAPNGKAALFGFNVSGTLVHLEASVRSASDYGLTITVPNISQGLPLTGTTLKFWGTPAAESHDTQRGHCIAGNLSHFRPLEGCPADSAEVPFLTNPADCSGGLLPTRLHTDSWERQGSFESRTIDHDVNGVPFEVGDCENVPFEATLSALPTTNAAASPTGLDVHLKVPQQGLSESDALASAHLKKAEVVLPLGMKVNPSSADGLAACSPDQIGLTTPVGQSPPRFSANPASCPESSKVGEVEIETPLLDHVLKGSVFLASQGTNPFKSTLALYLAVADPQTGIVIKLPGKVSPDPSTGQLTAVFDNNPQLPFSDLHLQFKNGPRAPLMTPATCGTYSTKAALTSWAGGPAVSSGNSFKIVNGPNGSPCPNNEFAPKFSAGTESPLAGTYSPFVLRFSRADGTQELSGVASATLPKGLTGKLAGIPYCSDAALGGIDTASGSGVAQIASPSCPAASQVGIVTAGAGAGPNPFYVKTGKAYLAGPYQGAPLSLAIVTPAVAGPFDLGNVVVRTALHVNRESTQISAGAAPLPRFLEGIPLDLRSVEVALNRPSFTLNPTSCDPMSIDATLTGVDGASANVSSRFQAGACSNLGFAPKLSLAVKGGTKRGAFQKLRAVVEVPAGQANIGKVSVALPHSVFLAQEHIRTICTRVQFAADACPVGSIYGQATAYTPLLDRPLEGPVYLRSSDHELPDLVAALRGQVDVDLVGRIDSVHGGIRNSFEAVPDAPVSKFVLEMKGGKKSLLVNSRNICKSTNKATVNMDGQNGKLHDFRPVLKNSCKKAKKSKKQNQHKAKQDTAR